MKIDIDSICNQIINIPVDDSKLYMLKDIKLDLDKYEYDISMNYQDAYYYLRECLLMDDSHNLLDLYLVHQYLCHCYLSKDVINNLYSASDNWKATRRIVKECFSSYRKIGAFQACIDQYEVLRKSNVWDYFEHTEKVYIMKEAAKSYRNIGKFSNALELYYICLLMNSESEQAWLGRVELLLKIGKVYRNYLMQIELAKFFVEEAHYILEEHRTSDTENINVQRYTVICLDTLGQIYRDEGKYDKAEKFFKESEKLFGEKGGRAYFHDILMKYQRKEKYSDVELTSGIEELSEAIRNLETDPMEEVGVGIRSVQLGRLKFMKQSIDRNEAYAEIQKGRKIALKYNDMKTVIRSYKEEASFCRQEGNYKDYVKISTQAVKLASDNNQLMLENAIIKDIISFSDTVPDFIDSSTKIELIKRRKDIYKQLVGFSKYSIGIVRNSGCLSFSDDKLIGIYKIVFEDFEQILGEMGSIVEIMYNEIDIINRNSLPFMDMQVQANTYKNILHKFKNDLPNESIIIQLKDLCDNIHTNNRLEYGSILIEANHQLEMFAQIIKHIKQSADKALRESEYEKEWCSLDTLIRSGIQNYFYSKPQYIPKISYEPIDDEIKILVRKTLFETTISEILNNAFNYMETLQNNKEIQETFRFFIQMKLVEKKTVVLKCYSQYSDNETAESAIESIKKGMNPRKNTAKEGSRYGFYSIKFLFEEVMGGKVCVMHEERRAGLSVQLPIDLVTVKIVKKDQKYGEEKLNGLWKRGEAGSY